MTTLHARTWRMAFVEEPARIAIGQPHQVFLSGMSVTFTAAFFYDALHKLPFLHPVAAGLIAVLGAVGAEYAYLKGLADGAAAGQRSRWQSLLIWTVFALLVISGTLVMLRYAYPLPPLANPDWWVATLLTLAHIVPLALLGLCSAKLHAEVEAAHVARMAHAEVEAAARRESEEAEQRRAEKERRQREVEIEQRRAAWLLEQETQDRDLQRKIEAARIKAELSARTRTDAPHAESRTHPHVASESPERAMSREELYAAVRVAYEADPNFSRADMARRSGWSEAMVRKALKEIQL